ncbi:GNAT family N-acetyltransferase [Kluyvera intermedia]|uniref:GNAT family N-acetyltransferase n=1 Tax=Kluyvera intermedia TaxID=61648 RepID=UPI0035240E67
MISETPSNEILNDALVQPLITGWAKSRGGKDVKVIHEHGHTHCVFKTPVGGMSRDRESFYWRGPSIVKSAHSFHQDRHHYLSIFGNDTLSDTTLAAADYKLLVREMLMCRPVGTGLCSTTVSVKRVQNADEADWFNQQKGHKFILPEHLSDNDVFDFYTCHDGLLTSYARAIHQNNFFVVDDVQTHPEYRRRGLASGILAEIAVTASRVGAHTEILIASEGGVPLYLREQFHPIAPLRVFSLKN